MMLARLHRLARAILVGFLLAEFPVRAEPLASLEGVVASSVRLSPDGQRIAMVVADGDDGARRRLLVDGEPSGGIYDEVAVGMPLFGVEGRRVAFVARRGDMVMVVVDGVEHEAGPVGPEGWPVQDLIIGPTGNATLWQARAGDKTHLVMNGRRLDAFEDAVGTDGKRTWGALGIVFDPSGQFFGFRAVRGAGMVAGIGRASGAANDPTARQVVLSPELGSVGGSSPIPIPGVAANEFALISWPLPTAEQKSPPENVCLFGTTHLRPIMPVGYDEIGRGTLVWTPSDPGGVWFTARKGDTWCVIVRGHEGPSYDAVGPVVPLPDGRAFHLAKKAGRVFPVLVHRDPTKREELPGGEGVEYPTQFFSQRGERFAYVSTEGAVSRLVLVEPGDPAAVGPVNTSQSPGYGGIDPARVVVSADGGRVAFVAMKSGHEFAVVDGREQQPFEKVSRPVFSSSGKRVGYRAASGGQSVVVIDGKVSEPFAEVSVDSPQFVPHLDLPVHAARSGATWRVWVDGKPGFECETLLGRLTLPDDGTGRVAYAARLLDRGRPVDTIVVDGRPIAEFDEIFMGGPRPLAIHRTATFFGRRGKTLVREKLDFPGVLLASQPLLENRAPQVVIDQASGGIVMQAPTDAAWDLPSIRGRFPGRELRFHASAGLGREAIPATIARGSIVAQIVVDDRPLAVSMPLRWGQHHVFDIVLPATGKVLKVVATDGGDGPQGDRAAWSDLVIVPAASGARSP
jgi:hypothetical protein